MEFIFDKNIISKNIRHLRKTHKLTQGALSTIIGAKITTYSNWETGVSLPDLDKIVTISKYFGISIDNILLVPHEQWMSEPESKTTVHKDNCDRCFEKERIIESQLVTIDALREVVAHLKIHGNVEILTEGSERSQKRKTG